VIFLYFRRTPDRVVLSQLKDERSLTLLQHVLTGEEQDDSSERKAVMILGEKEKEIHAMLAGMRGAAGSSTAVASKRLRQRESLEKTEIRVLKGKVDGLLFPSLITSQSDVPTDRK